MKWNQKTIHQWGIDTFGGAALNPSSLAIRMAKEAVELTSDLFTIDDVDVIKYECADVSIMLVQVANCLGMNLGEVLVDQSELLEYYDEVTAKCVNDFVCAKMVSELSIELISSINHGEFKHNWKVIVGIIAVLDSIEEIYEFDLDETIQVKMEINANRSWTRGADGSSQHVH